MPRTNYAHEQRRYRNDVLRNKLREQRQTDIANVLGITQGAVCKKIKNSQWKYEELCMLFANKEIFTEDEILVIMGRNPEETQERKMCKYILSGIKTMIKENKEEINQ